MFNPTLYWKSRLYLNWYIELLILTRTRTRIVRTNEANGRRLPREEDRCSRKTQQEIHLIGLLDRRCEKQDSHKDSESTKEVQTNLILWSDRICEAIEFSELSEFANLRIVGDYYLQEDWTRHRPNRVNRQEVQSLKAGEVRYLILFEFVSGKAEKAIFVKLWGYVPTSRQQGYYRTELQIQPNCRSYRLNHRS